MLFPALYVTFAIIGLVTKNNKKLRAWLSVIGTLIQLLILIYIFIIYVLAGGLLPGAGDILVHFLILTIVISLPTLGYFSGMSAGYFFEKSDSSSRHKQIPNIIGILILTWPLVTAGVVSAVTYPEQQRQKEAAIAKAEKRAAKRAETKQQYEERKQAEIELYEEKQRDNVYRFNLAGYDINLKAFKRLKVSFDGKTPPVGRGLWLWGNDLDNSEHSSDIYGIYVQTRNIKDGCPNTDLETALIWCGEHKVATTIYYRPYKIGELSFRRAAMKKTQANLLFSYDLTDLSENPSGLDPIPFNQGSIWRINKTPEFKTIYSDIYLVCRRLSVSEQHRDVIRNCLIGFRLNEEIFVDMSIQIDSKSMIESDSRSAVRQSLKYWGLIQN